MFVFQVFFNEFIFLANLEFYQVSQLVNSWKNNTAECLKPLAETKTKGIMAYFTKTKKEEVKSEPAKVKQEPVKVKKSNCRF